MSELNNDPNPQQFFADAHEPIARLVDLLRDQDTVDWDLAFVLAHSLKTSARGVHLEHVAEIAHCVELLIERTRDQVSWFHALVRAAALLHSALIHGDASNESTQPLVREARSLLAARASRGPLAWSTSPNPAVSVRPPVDDDDMFFIASDSSPVVTAQLPVDFLIKFVAESEEHLAKIEETLVALDSGAATDEQLGDAFRAMHSFKGNCGICGFTDMEQLTHRAETLMGNYRGRTHTPSARHISFLLELVDILRATLETIPGGDGRVAQLAALLAGFESLDREASTPPPVAPAETVEAVHQQQTPNNVGAKVDASTHRGVGSIRVDTSKLDELMNLVGELVIAETTVTKNPDLDGYEFENFQKAALNLNRLTRALQDIAMAVRMVPIESTFRKMTRLVRDVCTKQRKRVELICTGEETEVDKTVIETIADPLVHLIRNSIDHGIEPPAERAKVSKDTMGRVWLDAKHQGGEVWITIRDDGRGLNTEKILNKAIERGLADSNCRYSEREVFEMIFAPGFSTADQITDISGRGVGMDVVRRNVEAVNGRIDVSSELGKGTTFVLRIPLTLAIIEGMLVRVGRSFYTIPLLAIRESVKAEQADVTTLSDGSELLKLRRKHYPIVKLREFHRISPVRVSAVDGILVVVETGDRLACLLVDEVVGQRQTVVKPLPEYIKRVRGVAGCSILHNREISLILDVEGVVGAAQSRAA